MLMIQAEGTDVVEPVVEFLVVIVEHTAVGWV